MDLKLSAVRRKRMLTSSSGSLSGNPLGIWAGEGGYVASLRIRSFSLKPKGPGSWVVHPFLATAGCGSVQTLCLSTDMTWWKQFWKVRNGLHFTELRDEEERWGTTSWGPGTNRVLSAKTSQPSSLGAGFILRHFHQEGANGCWQASCHRRGATIGRKPSADPPQVTGLPEWLASSFWSSHSPGVRGKGWRWDSLGTCDPLL